MEREYQNIIGNSLRKLKWSLKRADEEQKARLASDACISRYTAGLLLKRGITSPEEAESYLRPSLSDICRPLDISGMEMAALRILEAVQKGEKILIFCDYDVDGVTGAAVLIDFLKKLGASVAYRIPHRLTEGYGLNTKAVREAADMGARLLITVDCGTTSIREAALAKELGINLIITDHHEPLEELPHAFAHLNPKVENNKAADRDVAGVGVAFLLVAAMRAMLREQDFWDSSGEPNLKEYLDLVAVGTLADLVPLRGSNRILVAHGLRVLGRSQRPGIKALCEVSDITRPVPSPGEVAFRLAPRINAAGRIGRADESLELLLTRDAAKARNLANRLDMANRRRQRIEEAILREAEKMTRAVPENEPIVLSSPRWHAGVIGIVASRLVDSFRRPVVLLAVENDIAKGSARSNNTINMFETLLECEQVLERFGGHRFAGGLTLKTENIGDFKRLFSAATKKRAGDRLADEPVLIIDDLLPLDRIDPKLMEEITALEPFGPGNPEPTFATPERVEVVEARSVRGGYLKMRIRDGRRYYDAICFEPTDGKLASGALCRLAFIPQLDVWQGVTRLQLKVKDIME